MKTELLPEHRGILVKLGSRIQLARLRRGLTMEAIATLSGISRGTLIKIEKGEEGVALGILFRVLIALGLEKDLDAIAKDDIIGRDILEEQLIKKHNIHFDN